MSKKIRIQKLQIPIYHLEINFIAGDREECFKYLESIYEVDLSTWNDPDNYGLTLTINKDLWVYFDPTDFSIGAIMHECGHITYEIFNYIGVDIKDQEAFLYLQQFIFEEILPLLPLTVTYKQIQDE